MEYLANQSQQRLKIIKQSRMLTQATIIYYILYQFFSFINFIISATMNKRDQIGVSIIFIIMIVPSIMKSYIIVKILQNLELDQIANSDQIDTINNEHYKNIFTLLNSIKSNKLFLPLNLLQQSLIVGMLILSALMISEFNLNNYFEIYLILTIIGTSSYILLQLTDYFLVICKIRFNKPYIDRIFRDPEIVQQETMKVIYIISAYYLVKSIWLIVSCEYGDILVSLSYLIYCALLFIQQLIIFQNIRKEKYQPVNSLCYQNCYTLYISVLFSIRKANLICKILIISTIMLCIIVQNVKLNFDDFSIYYQSSLFGFNQYLIGDNILMEIAIILFILYLIQKIIIKNNDKISIFIFSDQIANQKQENNLKNQIQNTNNKKNENNRIIEDLEVELALKQSKNEIKAISREKAKENKSIQIQLMQIYEQEKQQREENIMMKEDQENIQFQQMLLDHFGAKQFSNIKHNQRVDQQISNICPICTEHLEQSSKKALSCHPAHVFHKKCINQWLMTKNCCPLCRKQLK